MAGFVANGVITLTTDFGTRDGYVGAMKGVILSRFADARILDITHSIKPQDVRAGARVLANACPFFPAGTVHVAVIDPGVGTDRAVLAGLAGGQLFLAPDNGVLSRVLPERAPCWQLSRQDLQLDKVSRTFHGRDVFAPVAAALASGAVLPEDVGPRRPPKRLPAPALTTGPGYAFGEVIGIDRFGNLITNLGIDVLPEGVGLSHVHILFGEITIEGVAWSYAEVDVGDWLAVVGSNDTIELSVRDGDAARHCGARVGDPVKLLCRN